jgi:beta-glucanase (GH16 family)
MPESSQCWPTGGEVDIFEFVGNRIVDEIFGSYHWAKPDECGKDQEPIPGAGFKPQNAAEDWQTDFHVYGVEWNVTALTFFVDGIAYLARSRSHTLLPTAPMYVIFNQGVESAVSPPTPFTNFGKGVHLKVEWVRAYTLA